jgi:hypothetical protein
VFARVGKSACKRGEDCESAASVATAVASGRDAELRRKGSKKNGTTMKGWQSEKETYLTLKLYGGVICSGMKIRTASLLQLGILTVGLDPPNSHPCAVALTPRELISSFADAYRAPLHHLPRWIRKT